jgi:hypothetical protein
MHTKIMLEACAAIVITSACLATPVQGAFLEGKSLQVDWNYAADEQSPLVGASRSGVIVGPGVELMGFGQTIMPPLPPRVDIDISDTQILITLLINESPALYETFRFLDENFTIASFRNAKLNPASNWLGADPGFLGATDEVIDMGIRPVNGMAGQFILIDVVPEPAFAMMLVAAIAALAIARRPA